MVNEPVRRLHVPTPTTGIDRPRMFAEVIAAAKGKHILIPLKGHPDPDGIACALAQAHLSSRLGVGKTTIGYSHELSHRENRALVKLLNVELKKMKSVKEAGQVDFLSLVDCHDLETDLADTEGLEVLTIVDHHRAHLAPKAQFVDLRTDVGATATIFAEYLQELAPLDSEAEEDRRVATALMHGLA